MEQYLTLFAALFSVINPLGTVPVFVGLTKDDTLPNKAKTAAWTAINVFAILVIAFFSGEYVLAFFGISIQSLRLAGGLIIAVSGFSLLTGTFTKHKGMKRTSVQADVQTRSEVSLTPLAIPMLAGPGSISMLITFRETYNSITEMLVALAAMISVCLLIYGILRSSHAIVKLLGASGINAVSRIIGFIVIAIGVEYVTGAVLELLKTAV